MLQTIRDRAQGIFAWIILILIIVPFALWGIQNYFDTGKEKPIAVVGEREFFERDLLRLYEQQYARFSDRYDEAELKRQALERLVDDEVLFQTALEKGLTVSDAQVARFIRALPFFQTDGKFDEEKYQRLLTAQGLTTAGFVAQVRRALLLEQLRRSVTDSAFATEPEAERFYRLQNQRREISYVILPLPTRTVEVDDGEIQSYYEQHRDRFFTPERVTIEYVTLSIDDIAKTLQPEEAELKRYYEEQRQAFTTPEQRRIRHILVAVPENADEKAKQQALAKAREIRRRLLAGEDFAELARERSDDPGSKAKGGDLGFVRRGVLEQHFEKAAFTLSEGEISEPVETPFGYHIIQVTEIRPPKVKPFEAAKQQILETVRRQEAENRFYQLGEQLAQLAYENPQSLEPAATALGLKIQTAGPFGREDGEGIATDPKIRAAAFSAEVLEGNNSEPVELEDGRIVVLRVKAHYPPEQRPLDEVRAQIATELRRQKANRRLERQADAWLAELRQGAKLEDIAARAKTRVETVRLHRNPAPENQAVAELVDPVFQAPKPKQDTPVFLRVPLNDGRQALVAVTAIQEGNYADLNPQERLTLRDNLARMFGLLSFKEYQKQLRRRIEVKIDWPPAE